MCNPDPKDKKMENKSEIRIYVACLAAYNNGILYGRWIDAHQEAWTIYGEIADMLRMSPIPDAEEWAIHDYEGFEGVRVEEYAGIDDVAGKAAFIVEHGKLGAELITYYGSLNDARQAIEERYMGAYASVADFAQELTEQSTVIPETLRYYIDYDRMARDMEISDLVTIQISMDQVYVFWAN
jgi:antirestriction protein